MVVNHISRLFAKEKEKNDDQKRPKTPDPPQRLHPVEKPVEKDDPNKKDEK